MLSKKNYTKQLLHPWLTDWVKDKQANWGDSFLKKLNVHKKISTQIFWGSVKKTFLGGLECMYF